MKERKIVPKTSLQTTKSHQNESQTGSDCYVSDTYSYANSYNGFCGTIDAGRPESDGCSTLGTISGLTTFYLVLAITASIVTFCFGVFLIIFGCCRNRCCHSEGKNEEDPTTTKSCVRCCTSFCTEWSVALVNLFTGTFFVSHIFCLICPNNFAFFSHFFLCDVSAS